ncbi:MAG: isocitrate lyase/phosphoenolpyruvate mutase family protein [Actinomycetota bacterium]
MTAVDRARLLRSLHRPGDPLVLVNVWDVAGARTVASQPGTRAIATASWSIAASLGVPDGEVLSLTDLLAVVARIATAVELPVSADLELGYGATPADVRETIAAAIGAGAVGCNLEDSLPDGSLRPLEDQLARLRAAREAADDASLPLVINARTDALVAGGDLDEAISRGRAYRAAGADCVFILGVDELVGVEALVDALEVVSVLAGPGRPSVTELASAGVARISIGPGGMGLAYAALGHAAAELTAHGEYPAELAYRPPFPPR